MDCREAVVERDALAHAVGNRRGVSSWAAGLGRHTEQCHLKIHSTSARAKQLFYPLNCEIRAQDMEGPGVRVAGNAQLAGGRWPRSRVKAHTI